MDFTPNKGQHAAIYTRGKELLVSASAGAGKTKSLCWRIVTRLADQEAPASLSRMLVVTFTKAAAAEMRKRIGEYIRIELKDAAERGDEKTVKHLKKQLLLLPLAKISTIDSFCLELVRNNFEKLHISPGVRVADGSELEEMKERIMRRCMGALYDEDPSLMGQLTDGLLTVYADDKLPEELVRFYEQTLCEPGGYTLLEHAARIVEEDAQKPYFESFCGGVCGEKTLEELSFFVEEYERYLSFLEGDEENTAQYAFVKKELEGLIGLRALFLKDPEEYCRYLQEYELARFKGAKGGAKQSEYFKLLRKNAKSYIESKKKQRVDYDLSESPRLLSESAQILRLYARLFALYEGQLQEKKRKMGVMEFSDILLFAEKLFYDEQGEKTELARETAREFDEIYIDEFQDVNGLQEKIFLALCENNRFLVGDVKQSIYGFRGACPDIFSSMRDRFPSALEEGVQGKIFLTENYRSNEGVLRFVNSTCGRLLSLCTDMSYFKEDDLVAGKKSAQTLLPHICLISGGKNNEFLSDAEDKEAEYTARCIKELIDGGRAPCDIAILVRSRGKKPERIASALAKHGVRAAIEKGSSFFEAPEILLACALLEAIDKPTDDIALAAIMKSPIFGFTMQELTEIRLAEGKKGSLFASVCAYGARTGEERVCRVPAFLAEYRALSMELTVEKLLWKRYDDLSLLPLLCMGEEEERAEQIGGNLLYFYDMASAFSANSQGRLGAFLAHISYLSQKGKGVESEKADAPADAVQVMTFHGSKGLEFPVCWLYGCGDRLALSGKSIPFDRTLGPRFPLVQREEGILSSKNALYHAIETRAREKGLNEELRLLYVAMTRAVEELYISGTASKDLLTLFEVSECIETKRGHSELMGTPSYLSFIACALGMDRGSCQIHTDAFPWQISARQDALEEKAQEQTGAQRVLSDHEQELLARYKERLSFVYPYEDAVSLPAKLAVSKLSPDIFDEEREEEQELL
ncbi:MAG: UvrD-helicase domain-containing protein, partial [Clostridia bacterium]|nr:UvrD-helicase domain-containing protein [Clostridia bacterium]